MHRGLVPRPLRFSPVSGAEWVVVFDLDGTLVDTADELADAYDEAFRSAGLPERGVEWVRPLIGRPPEEIFAKNGADGVSAQRLTVLLRTRLAHVAGSRARVFDDVRPTLDRLTADGVIIAVATNRPTALARQVLSRTGLLERVAAVIGGDLGPPKPEPALVFEAAARAAAVAGLVEVRALAMVGDTADDVLAGKAVGALTVAVARDDLHLGAIRQAEPDRILSTLSELRLPARTSGTDEGAEVR